ncbi:MAG: glycerate kinase [Chloroflexi bacterium]|nr:glycerate kinase [Chloroflexota bacterium]
MPTYRFPESLTRGIPGREKALEILTAALVAADPVVAVKRHMRLQGTALTVGERQYDLRQYDRILVVGAGKAGAPMSLAVEEVLGDRISTGLVNVKYGYTLPTARITLHEAGHPLPDENGIRGTQRIVDLLKSSSERDLVISLISGGGSALLVLPQPGISLADMSFVTDDLLRCGATINEMNAVRKHLSQVKGGGVAALAYPAEIVSLMLSDVISNPLDVIASGPTVPDSSTFADAWRILEKCGLEDRIPCSVRDHLRSGLEGKIPETPKAGDPMFQKTYNVVIASNDIAAAAAKTEAERLGFNALLLTTHLEGEAREVGKVLAAVAKEIARSGNPVPKPACVVAGGETTVTVRGKGLGGRDQELALGAAIGIAGLPGVIIVSAATDGGDGPTDAAGALVDGTTVPRAGELGLDPVDFLDRSDSYNLFKALDDLIITGPTNTNVNDLFLVLVSS